jgi:hypothetical protein
MAADKEKDELPKLDSDPPPGEDANNAPTKVGPMTADAWVALIRQADIDARAEKEKAKGTGPEKERPKEPEKKSPPRPGATDTSKIGKVKEDALLAKARGDKTSTPAPAPTKPPPARSPSAKPPPTKPPPARMESEPPEDVDDDELESTDPVELPRTYNEDDEDENAATLVHSSAKPPSHVAPIAVMTPSTAQATGLVEKMVAELLAKESKDKKDEANASKNAATSDKDREEGTAKMPARPIPADIATPGFNAPPNSAPLPPPVTPLAPTDTGAWPFTPDLLRNEPAKGVSPFLVGAGAFVLVFLILGAIALYFLN